MAHISALIASCFLSPCWCNVHSVFQLKTNPHTLRPPKAVNSRVKLRSQKSTGHLVAAHAQSHRSQEGDGIRSEAQTRGSETQEYPKVRYKKRATITIDHSDSYPARESKHPIKSIQSHGIKFFRSISIFNQYLATCPMQRSLP